jgi:hypothetical protein
MLVVASFGYPQPIGKEILRYISIHARSIESLNKKTEEEDWPVQTRHCVKLMEAENANVTKTHLP